MGIGRTLSVGEVRGVRRRVARSRRGLTFLEVVLATVILASMAAVVMTALNLILAQSERQIAKLGAMELANRLMIIFLDDENEFKRQPKDLEFEGRWYRWVSKESDVTVVPVVDGESVTAIRSAERLRNVDVNVWLAARSGGSDAADEGVPSARVVRLVDIIYMNPDSVDNSISTPEGQRRLVELVTRRQGGARAVPRPSGSGSGGGSRSMAPTTTPGGAANKGGSK